LYCILLCHTPAVLCCGMQCHIALYCAVLWCQCYIMWHGRTGRKKLRGRKEICPTFSDCSRVVKKFSGETLKNCCRRGGRSDYEKFLLDSIFHTKLTEFPTKLTEFVPFIYIIGQYCRLWSEYCPTGFVCPTNWEGCLRPVRPCNVMYYWICFTVFTALLHHTVCIPYFAIYLNVLSCVILYCVVPYRTLPFKCHTVIICCTVLWSALNFIL
jgi:hypothetical protein